MRKCPALNCRENLQQLETMTGLRYWNCPVHGAIDFVDDYRREAGKQVLSEVLFYLIALTVIAFIAWRLFACTR